MLDAALAREPSTSPWRRRIAKVSGQPKETESLGLATAGRKKEIGRAGIELTFLVGGVVE
ncbi:MAG: hypothetical protein R2755_23500 [Acidimicrobiales bacterium]